MAITARRTPATLSWRKARQLSGRLSWGIADQAMSTLTNFLLSIYVARTLGAAQFGAFSLAYLTYGFAINASRGLSIEPLLIRFSGTDLPTWRRAAAGCTGTALIVGFATGLCGIMVGLIGGPTGMAFLALGLTMPGLLLQDSWRYSFFALGRGYHAFINDTIWAAVQIPALVLLKTSGHASVFWFVLAWGLSAGVGAVVGSVQARVVPNLVAAVKWLVRHRDLGPRYLVENTGGNAADTLRSYTVSYVLGLDAVGYMQAANVLMGPFKIIYFGMGMITIPEAARLLRESPRRLPQFCVAVSLGLTVLAMSWAIVLLVALPRGLGHMVLGAIWRPAYPLVLPAALAITAMCATTGAGIGLHALAAARRSLRATLVTSALVVTAAIAGAVTGGAIGTMRYAAAAAWIGTLVSWFELRQGLYDHGGVPVPAWLWPRQGAGHGSPALEAAHHGAALAGAQHGPAALAGAQYGPDLEATRPIPVFDRARYSPDLEATRPIPAFDRARYSPDPDATRPIPVFDRARYSPDLDATRPIPVLESMYLSPTLGSTYQIPPLHRSQERPPPVGRPVRRPVITTRRRAAPDPVAARERSVRRRINAAWGLLYLNTMTYIGGTSVIPLPSKVGKAIAQSALPLAILLLLTVNRKVKIRPNVFLCLVCVLVADTVLTAVQVHHLGTIFRTTRMAEYVAALWLLTPWWGRTDMLLLRCHLRWLYTALGSVLCGVLISHHRAFSFDGRLTGAIWPMLPTQIAQYAAVACGLTVVLWLARLVSGRATLAGVAVSIIVLLLTHTRTALVALIAGIVVAGLSLFTVNARVRKFFTTTALVVSLGVVTVAGFVTTWLARGENAQGLATLTGRTNFWALVLNTPRDKFQEIFGFGLSSASINGLPIDSNWLAGYMQEGLVGVVACATILVFLLVAAFFQPPGARRALALFLAIYCLLASFTEDAFTDVSTYLLELTVAASLLAVPLLREKRRKTGLAIAKR